jgi:hypothetical protein
VLLLLHLPAHTQITTHQHRSIAAVLKIKPISTIQLNKTYLQVVSSRMVELLQPSHVCCAAPTD